MNIIKSAAVVLFLLLLLVLAVFVTIKLCKLPKSKVQRIVLLIVVWLVAISFVVALGDYAYPFERTLHPVLIAEFEVPEKYWLDYPGEQFWRGAYEAYGLYAESFYFDPAQKESMYGFDWPPMDFEHYSYIITYGQKIQSLTYNVWETIDTPVRTGAKVGHMVLAEEFKPEMVYIYQIPKMRIDNDINGTGATQPKKYYTEEDFQSIVVGESTVHDVYDIAPSLVYTTGYGGVCEFPMENGEYIQVKLYGEELIVGAIEITQQSYASTTGRG